MTNKNTDSRYAMDMCSGPILGKMLLFALPLIASSMLQLLFNAADVIVVGKFAGDNSLAAVGSNGSLVGLLTNLFLGLSVGVNVLVARYYGANDTENIEDTVHTAIAISIISGVILTLVGCLGAGALLKLMNVPDEVRPLSTVYLRIYFLGMTAMMVYNFGAAVLRAIGDTRRPLIYLLIAGIINVILNLFFVIVLKMDVAGVALATVISQCVSCYLIVRCLITEGGSIRLDPRRLRVSPNKLARIAQIGLPASIQSVLFNISNVLIQASINTFGATVVAGCSAGANLEQFVYVAMNANYQSTLSFTSQNMGAGKHDRINRILFCGLGCVTVIGLILGNLWVVFSRPLLSLYTSSPEVIAEGAKRMAIIAGPYFICGLMDVMVGSLRGLGYSVLPMLVSLIGACGLRVVFILTAFRLPAFHKAENLYLTYPVSWTITFLAHVVCFIIIRRRLESKWTQFGHVRYRKEVNEASWKIPHHRKR